MPALELEFLDFGFDIQPRASVPGGDHQISNLAIVDIVIALCETSADGRFYFIKVHAPQCGVSSRPSLYRYIHLRLQRTLSQDRIERIKGEFFAFAWFFCNHEQRKCSIFDRLGYSRSHLIRLIPPLLCAWTWRAGAKDGRFHLIEPWGSIKRRPCKEARAVDSKLFVKITEWIYIPL